MQAKLLSAASTSLHVAIRQNTWYKPMPEGSQTYKEPIYIHVSHASVSSVTSEDVTYQASTSWHNMEMYLLNLK